MFIYLAYIADQDLGILGEEAIRKVIQERTGGKKVEVELERISQHTPILFRSRSNSPTSESQDSLNQVAAQIRRFPNVNCAIMVPSGGRQPIIAQYQRRAEQIQKYLAKETLMPVERLPIKSTKETGNSIMLEILTGGIP